MRIIDADNLIKEIHRYALDVYCIDLRNSKEFAGSSKAENYCEGLYEATELIDDTPTIDAVPVVHGHWEECDLTDGKDVAALGHKRCSVCHDLGFLNEDAYGYWNNQTLSNYCTTCGAKMDGGIDETN